MAKKKKAKKVKRKTPTKKRAGAKKKPAKRAKAKKNSRAKKTKRAKAKRKRKTATVNRPNTPEEISEALDISARTLTEYRKKGLPHDRPKGKQKFCMYNLGEVAQWMVNEGLSGKGGHGTSKRTDAREKLDIRRLTALTEKYEHEVAAARGESVNAADVRTAWVRKAVTIRNALEGIGATVAALWPGKDAGRLQEDIDTAIRVALNRLCRPDDTPGLQPDKTN